ncbi:hypothetical protein [Vagococcus hydrophili]|uniref:Uncharacterized protein n=1 Tax=Vagococcus hydrophili TaxID=2714947 RepID=A0A6G8AU32_9ENTE|nr:hypothetical protein [Vagococcus hydrophili]QIL48497.1 hypothetical protein G7082_08290 [Vagococcus hydrophili]
MKSRLKELINKKVIKSSSGGGAGSILVIELENSSYFFIWCAWRIECEDVVIVTSFDTIEPTEFTNSLNGYIGEKVPLLVGNRVLDITLTPQYDLRISFENNYVLHVFCDIGFSREDYNINWELNIPHENISIEINNHFEEQHGQYN